MKTIGKISSQENGRDGGTPLSKSEIRRLIKQGAVKKDGKVIKDIFALAENGIYKIGKRKFLKIIILSPL